MSKEALRRELMELFGFPVCTAPGCKNDVTWELGKEGIPACTYHASARGILRLRKLGLLK